MGRCSHEQNKACLREVQTLQMPASGPILQCPPPPWRFPFSHAEPPVVSQTQLAPSHLWASVHALLLHGDPTDHPLFSFPVSASRPPPPGSPPSPPKIRGGLRCTSTVPCVCLTLFQGRDCVLLIFFISVCSRHSTVSGASMLLVGYTNIKAAGPGCDIMCSETSPGMNTPREPPLGIEASDGSMGKGMEPRDCENGC